MNYQTSEERRLESANKLNIIDTYRSDLDSIKNRANSSIANLYIEGYKDITYRDYCIKASNNFNDAFNEGNYIGGIELKESVTTTTTTKSKGLFGILSRITNIITQVVNKQSNIVKWLAKSNYNLSNYVNGVASTIVNGVECVPDAENNKYPVTIEDMSVIFSSFKRKPTSYADHNKTVILSASTNSKEKDDTLIKREREVLNLGSPSIYDDEYFKVRTKTSYEWTEIVTDIETKTEYTSGFFGLGKKVKNVKTIEHKKPVITGVETKDTSEDISIPSIDTMLAQIQGTTTYDPNTSLGICQSILGVKSSITSTIAGSINADLYTSNIELDEYGNKYANIQIHDANYTKAFADNLDANLPEYMFFAKDGDYGFYKVIYKQTERIDGINIKDEISSEYNKDAFIKDFIYDYYNEVYFKDRYVLDVILLEISGVYSPNKVLTYTNSMSNSIYYSLLSNFKDKLVTSLQNSYNVFKSANLQTRCSDGDPESNYSSFINYLKGLNCYNSKGCEMLISYINSSVWQWLRLRSSYLLNTMKNRNIMENFINAMKNRMNKNTGTLMMWYQGCVALDIDYYDVIEDEYKTVTLNTKDLYVVKAADDTDENCSCNCNNPKFIDIQDNDSFYAGKDFKVGDTIYIIDDTHLELACKVTNIGSIDIATVNTSEIDVNNIDAALGSNLNQTKRLRRLYLNAALPDFYCKGNDVSTLRVIRIE